ncbi:hypothetical protein K0T92_23270 [Paenibacillus oenotherae]|uniref:Uncharacterized protein n=1 Tax=Paenibacillus oenotherae TaxID=1435645 RepID=A0ABS7DCM2_9BACL|nr:hypothetical protein [Paenibacillus oenotherae]MBW7477646.1 hypothetical protein [Paenibacillus oenotherae]
MAMKDQEMKDLATQRDIDPDYGLFVDEVDEDVIPGAEEELLEIYPYDEVLRVDEDRVSEAEDKGDDSPVDPAAPEDGFHGTDLLNGVGHEPEKED